MVQPIRSPQRPHDVPEHPAATTSAQQPGQRGRRLRAGANPQIAGLPARLSAVEGASSSSSIEATSVEQQRPEPASRATVLAARQRDVDAILALASEIREIQTQLLALKAPAQFDVPDTPALSQAEVQQAIARLEARNDIAQRSVDTLGKQCERARAVVEKLNASLEEKSGSSNNYMRPGPPMRPARLVRRKSARAAPNCAPHMSNVSPHWGSRSIC